MSEVPDTQLAKDESDNQPQAVDSISGIEGATSGELAEKDIDIGDESHPLAQQTGTTGAIKRKMNDEAIHEYLADLIYDSNSAFFREFNQNAETACIRAAKLMLSTRFSDDILKRKLWIRSDTGKLVTSEDDMDRQAILAEYNVADGNLKRIKIPQSIHNIVEFARQEGYDPTIEVSVHFDERKVVYQDPGIGMTAEEADQAFNVTGNSGVRGEGDTGGMMGMGALTFKNLTGQDGGMTAETRTRRPNAMDYDYDGFRFYAYLGGMNQLPNKPPEGFKGTRFEVPVEESVDMSKFREWVEEYSRGLRVPVLYKEYRDGECRFEEEYGGESFVEMMGNPPVVVDRPGEFTVVAGPNVPGTRRNDLPNTYLVSMPIDRNTHSGGGTLWNVAIRIHDEQGRIVHGPHRGQYASEVDNLHSEDIVTPEPTADRDRLQRGSRTDEFVSFAYKLVKIEEQKIAADFISEVDTKEDVLEMVMEDPDGWTIFRKLVRKHGPHGVTGSQTDRLKDYMEDTEHYKDFDDEEVYDAISKMFNKMSVAPRHRHGVSKKARRKNERIGDILSRADPEHVFMAASTSGRFNSRAKVVWNTYDDAEVIVLDSSSGYTTYGNLYGFKKLKNVPLKNGEDGRYDVPQPVHDQQVKREHTDDGDDNEDVSLEEQTINIRLKYQKKNKIDRRDTIEQIREKFGRGGNGYGRRADKLVVFPRGAEENVSDNLGMSRYEAIASVTNAELEAIHDLEHVMTYEEYKAWSEGTAVATEDGGKTVAELVEMRENDDRQILLAQIAGDYQDQIRTLLDDDNKELREYLAEDIQGQLYWNLDDNESKPDVMWAIMDEKTYRRAEYALNDQYWSNKNMTSVRFGSRFIRACNSSSPNNSIDHYRRKIATPDWPDDHDVYKTMDRAKHKHWLDSDLIEAMYFGLHNRGVDPDNVEPETLQTLVENA